MVFASAEPVTARSLQRLLPDDADADAVFAALRAHYEGRGVVLAEIAGGWQFRTAADLAPALRKVIIQPRRLPRAAMETLAVIAYHQPVTRPEIEEIRGISLSQGTMDALLESGMIVATGRREVPGRPTIWATTPAFLAQVRAEGFAGAAAPRGSDGRTGAAGAGRPLARSCRGLISRPPFPC